MRMADPENRSGAMDSFGYKQLLFEPVVGGGLFTGMSVALIMTYGEYKPNKAPFRWLVPAPRRRRHLRAAFAAAH